MPKHNPELRHLFNETDCTTAQMRVRAVVIPESALLTREADAGFAKVLSQYVRSLCFLDSEGYRGPSGQAFAWDRKARACQTAVRDTLGLIISDWPGQPMGLTQWAVEETARYAMYPDAKNPWVPFAESTEWTNSKADEIEAAGAIIRGEVTYVDIFGGRPHKAN